MKQPFGEHDCESEIKKLGSKYSELFFDQTPFNIAALDPDTYLIVGRRGAGKTALCHYFSFQRDIRNAVYIDVDEPKVYERVLAKIANHSLGGNGDTVAKSSDIWEYLIWKLIIAECNKWNSCGNPPAGLTSPSQSPAALLDTIIDWLKEKIGIRTDESNEPAGISNQKLALLVMEQDYSIECQKVLAFSVKTPIFLAIDTLEKYNVNDTGLMNAMAGLVEAAAKMNTNYASLGVHIKVFMSGEVFPHLLEVDLLNPLKSVKQEVYMIWRSKDLLRLIAWRFHHFLKGHDLLARSNVDEIIWTDPKGVMEKAWIPFFGKEIKNRNGIVENSFSYVLRHTQMRPRQLIVLCNAIAKKAIEGGTFPRFTRENIVDGIEQGERKLAGEILNSYSQVYPGANEIVRVLSQISTIFLGNQLDKRAPESKRHWKSGDYSPAAFSRLVTELGIVGRVARESLGYIDAEFAYAQNYRIDLMHRDTCAIHPMFFKLLNITQPTKPVIIMPFSVSNDDEKWLTL